MNEKNKGFVLLWRKIQDNRLWLQEPFTRGQAWVDLFLLANHTSGNIIIRGNIVEIKRGQLGWSEESLGERWKWSRGKVKRYLSYLETIQQIERQKSHIISLITVINYEKYQKNNTPDDTTDSTTDGHQTVQQTDTNNNVNNGNNVKNVNNSVRRFAPPTFEEVQKYCLERNNSVDPQRFIDYYTSNGWRVGKNPMKDWQATIRTWEKGQTSKPLYEKITI